VQRALHPLPTSWRSAVVRRGSTRRAPRFRLSDLGCDGQEHVFAHFYTFLFIEGLGRVSTGSVGRSGSVGAKGLETREEP
jgi:hypothetical protein